MAKKQFSVEQIEKEVREVQDYTINKMDSEVYQAWADMSDSWIQEGAICWEGFKGFKERTFEEILEDFEINNRVLNPKS